jgi:hypothetical protein
VREWLVWRICFSLHQINSEPWINNENVHNCGHMYFRTQGCTTYDSHTEHGLYKSISTAILRWFRLLVTSSLDLPAHFWWKHQAIFSQPLVGASSYKIAEIRGSPHQSSLRRNSRFISFSRRRKMEPRGLAATNTATTRTAAYGRRFSGRSSERGATEICSWRTGDWPQAARPRNRGSIAGTVCLLRNVHTSWDPPSLPFNGCRGPLPGIMRPKRDTDRPLVMCRG